MRRTLAVAPFGFALLTLFHVQSAYNKINSPHAAARGDPGVARRRKWPALLLLFAIVLAGLTGAPEARAGHVCQKPGIECTPAVAGPWSFWVSIGVSNPASIFPVVLDRFATEGEAIAAGSAAVCLPDRDHRLGYTTCSCSATSVPTLTTLAWSFGLESFRGPGNIATADYLIDYSNLGTCDSSNPWPLSWSVAGVRTISCPAGYTADGPFFPEGHNPAEACYRGTPAVCPIKDIPPFGPPDPLPLDMTNISPLARGAADCLLAGLGIVNIGGAGDEQVFSSGFRTLEYQKHFADLWRKWRYELENNTDARCVDLKAKIKADYESHKLGGDLPPTDPAKIPNNCHSSGTCFDVHTARIPGVDQNAFACKVNRPYPIDDKWHVVPF